MEEKTYIRISLPGSDSKDGYIDFSTVSMTQEDFSNLPEFTGF